MCVQLEFTIHRGTHLCPPTPLAHTREESRTLRSRIVNSNNSWPLKQIFWQKQKARKGNPNIEATQQYSQIKDDLRCF